MQINIDLNVSSNFNKGISPNFDNIKYQLKRHGFVVSNARIQKSNTEDTFVANIDHHLNAQQLRNRLTNIANVFNQDCIAVKYDDNKGELIGSYSHLWGAFDNQYFIDV